MSSFFEIFLVFLRLGLTSFGGPIAHLAYFREEFVHKRQWLNDNAYAEIVAVSQFVPGPASSQTGFALGVLRGGLKGGLAAWLGFTLPSAVLMLLLAYGLSFAEAPILAGFLHGLKLFAVAIVAQAVWSMGRTLCPDAPRAGFAFLSAAILISFSNNFLQLAIIACGAIFGLVALPKQRRPIEVAELRPVYRGSALTALLVFAILLLALPVLASLTTLAEVKLASIFYQTGALVFGGGHVVLPLLEESIVKPGFVDRETFLTGYGAVQAVPGPLFTISAFLGAKSTLAPGNLGAFIALVSIFLPGLLLVYGVLAFWGLIRSSGFAQAALAGVNAAVVGILGAALYQPIWTSTIKSLPEASIAVLSFAALVALRLPVLVVAVLTSTAGLILMTL